VFDSAPPAARWLLLHGLAYSLVHHQGVVLSRLGESGISDTRWADWLDLLTPVLVLGPALAALLGVASRRVWVLAILGSAIYVEGHGIHLAANSIANATDPDIPVVHLWDEVVGHYVWYGGLALVWLALWLTHAETDLDIDRRLGLPLIVGVGGTWATNALEGGTAVASLIVAVGFAALAVAQRARPLGRFALVSAVLAIVMIGGYGLWQGGFPQPSEVGIP